MTRGRAGHRVNLSGDVLVADRALFLEGEVLFEAHPPTMGLTHAPSIRSAVPSTQAKLWRTGAESCVRSRATSLWCAIVLGSQSIKMWPTPSPHDDRNASDRHP